jgi:phospholipid transport system substrate-binding protein
MMRRRLPLALLLLCAVSLPLLAQAVAPDALLERRAAFILRTLAEQREVFEADPAGLHALIREELMPYVDTQYSARLVLGRAGRGAEPAQIDAFARAMAEQLVQRYASGLLAFRSEEQLEVLPVRGELNPKATRVRTRVKLDSGDQAAVDYVFRLTGDEWKVFDILIEGISYVTTYRNQISPQVAADGIDTVTQRLETGELRLND